MLQMHVGIRKVRLESKRMQMDANACKRKEWKH